MKRILTLASALLLPVAVPAHPLSSTNEAERTVTAHRVNSERPTPQPVRLTVAPAPAPTEPGITGLTAQPPVPTTDQELMPELANPLAWTSPVLSLREIPVVPARRSRGNEAHGVIPRAARPSNPGLAGFLLGFSNLLNPFAPRSMGVETTGENWYDGSVRSNPLPWGLRDERFHEPQTPEFSTELNRLLSLQAGKREETRPTPPILQGPLLTNVP